jgi:hypothetical protein
MLVIRKVVCINDKKLPQGAELTEGKEYEVVDEFVNSWDQKVYILKNTINGGITSKGMRWYGFDAIRFADLDSKLVEDEEYLYNYVLN